MQVKATAVKETAYCNNMFTLAEAEQTFKRQLEAFQPCTWGYHYAPAMGETAYDSTLMHNNNLIFTLRMNFCNRSPSKERGRVINNILKMTYVLSYSAVLGRDPALSTAMLQMSIIAVAGEWSMAQLHFAEASLDSLVDRDIELSREQVGVDRDIELSREQAGQASN